MATKPKNETKPADTNKPVAVFRARGVKVSVFANQADNGIIHKTSIQRIYRLGEDWKTTTSLGRDDLPIAQHLLNKAWAWILETEAQTTKETAE